VGRFFVLHVWSRDKEQEGAFAEGKLGKMQFEPWGRIATSPRHVRIYTIETASLQENSFYFVVKALGARR
jgi:hypothetical protein